MNKQGVVVAKDGSLATVEIYNNPNCLTCTKRTKQNACHSCADYDDNHSFRIVAINDNCAEIGDRVCESQQKTEGSSFFGLFRNSRCMCGSGISMFVVVYRR